MLETFFKVLYVAGALALILYVETLKGSDWLFATVLIWIAIGIYCYVRFGPYGDKL